MTKKDLKTLLSLLRRLHDEHPQWTSLDTAIALVKALLRQPEVKT
jgi:hypothetical protein